MQQLLIIFNQLFHEPIQELPEPVQGLPEPVQEIPEPVQKLPEKYYLFLFNLIHEIPKPVELFKLKINK